MAAKQNTSPAKKIPADRPYAVRLFPSRTQDRIQRFACFNQQDPQAFRNKRDEAYSIEWAIPYNPGIQREPIPGWLSFRMDSKVQAKTPDGRGRACRKARNRRVLQKPRLRPPGPGNSHRPRSLLRLGRPQKGAGRNRWAVQGVQLTNDSQTISTTR